MSLFNLNTDVGESINVAGQHPEIIKMLLEKIETMKEDLGDDETPGSGKRPSGWQFH
jgi:arylsulfatase A